MQRQTFDMCCQRMPSGTIIEQASLDELIARLGGSFSRCPNRPGSFNFRIESIADAHGRAEPDRTTAGGVSHRFKNGWPWRPEAETSSLPNVSWIVIHFVPLQNSKEFLLEGVPTMMFYLTSDVRNDRVLL